MLFSYTVRTPCIKMSQNCDRPLRVSIFPYIPDLAGDKLLGLRNYIANKFEEATAIKVDVSSEPDPYDLRSLKSKYLSSGSDAYDIMEVDTILLRELVKSDKVKMLDSVDTRDFFNWCVQSVTVGDYVYGAPTLQCASFLMEIVSHNHAPLKALLKDGHSFEQLKSTLGRQQEDGYQILLAGDFRGTSRQLPMFYLDAYVDQHEESYCRVCEEIDAPVCDSKLIESMTEFTDYGKLTCKNGPDFHRTFHEHPKVLIKDVVDIPHILMYSYSECLGEMMACTASKKKHKRTLQIISPPLETSNYLITYTDALVVNKCSDPSRIDDIAKFVEFYTSLDFRTSYAFGHDLPPRIHSPRYVLPARTDFFTETAAAGDEYYHLFHKTLVRHAIPATNHRIEQN